MYEKKTVPVKDPQRFHVEISFSPGAAYNPVQVVSVCNDHALPVVKRCVLNQASLAPQNSDYDKQMMFSCCYRL
jgi:hypothetical protein